METVKKNFYAQKYRDKMKEENMSKTWNISY